MKIREIPLNAKYFSAEAFLARYRVDPDTGCHEWTGCRDRHGYGAVAIDGGVYRAHRVSYALQRKEPGPLFACHRCDNRLCGNPDHIFLGTSRDNLRDMGAKGRTVGFNVHNPNRRLSDEDVIAILSSPEHRDELAYRYGITRQYVTDLKNGRKRPAAFRVWKGTRS